MFKKSAAALITLLALTACSTSQPRVIQASADSPNIILTVGMATQIEMPDAGHVQSITVGKPKRVASIALANKMARVAWAVLTKGGVYCGASAT